MPVTTRITNLLRKLSLLRLAENLRFRWQQWKYSKANKAFRQSHPHEKFPPDYFVYETYRLSLSDYYEDGKATAKEILSTIGNHIDLHRSGFAILDWGCGPGRITRHLPGLLPAASIHGTDYNERYITWCKQHLPGIEFSKNNIHPPLPYADAFFDAIIGISIFTHLSAAGHRAWLEELYRISKPGAIIFLTMQGSAYRGKLLPAEQQQFDRGELVTRENTREGNRLFSAFQPRVFVEHLVAGKFTIIDFIPAPATGEAGQDVWVLEKV
jgi:cyclopropane fatty-acyl-phospholipid synthase-like methyltransferase